MSTIHSILYVDDDEAALALVASSVGCERRLFTANTASAALEIARREPMDLALVDLHLSDALPLLRDLNQLQPALTATVIDVLAKPFAVPALIARLEHPTAPVRATPATLDRVVWEYVHRVVDECGGNLSAAARCPGIDRNTLKRKLARDPVDRRVM